MDDARSAVESTEEHVQSLVDAGVELDLDPDRVRVFSKGQPVLTIGEPSNWFGYLLSGDLDVVASDGSSVATLAPGAIVGELGLLTRRPRNATVVARTAAKLWTGHESDLLALLSSDDGAQWLRRLAAGRLAAATNPIQIRTRSGRHALVRPVLSTDATVFREELRHLSKESIRLRFFSASLPPDSVVNYLLDADHFNHAVWAALDPVELNPIGSVRCIRSHDRPTDAELAVGLVDRAQGGGVGSALVSLIGQVAVSLGITRITAEVLTENEPMRRLLSSPSTQSSFAEPGVIHFSLNASDLAGRLTDESQRSVDTVTRSLVSGLYSIHEPVSVAES